MKVRVTISDILSDTVSMFRDPVWISLVLHCIAGVALCSVCVTLLALVLVVL